MRKAKQIKFVNYRIGVDEFNIVKTISDQQEISMSEVIRNLIKEKANTVKIDSRQINIDLV